MKILIKFLNFYQKYISFLKVGGSCRYYPTCSEYSKWQFETNNIFVAFFSSTLRILRCNQLFEGGIDYPIIDCKKLQKIKNYKKIDVKYWIVPKNKRKCFVIKNISKDNYATKW